MFNLAGGEIIVLLLIGLVVLGPEKLPDALRKFGRVYSEVRRVASVIQRDVTSTFNEPMTELRKTADEAKRFFTGTDTSPSSTSESADQQRQGAVGDSDDPPFVPYEAPPGPTPTEATEDGPAQ